MLRLLRQRLRCRWRRTPHARLQCWPYPSLARLLEKPRDIALVPAVEHVRERRLLGIPLLHVSCRRTEQLRALDVEQLDAKRRALGECSSQERVSRDLHLLKSLVDDADGVGILLSRRSRRQGSRRNNYCRRKRSDCLRHRLVTYLASEHSRWRRGAHSRCALCMSSRGIAVRFEDGFVTRCRCSLHRLHRRFVTRCRCSLHRLHRR